MRTIRWLGTCARLPSASFFPIVLQASNVFLLYPEKGKQHRYTCPKQPTLHNTKMIMQPRYFNQNFACVRRKPNHLPIVPRPTLASVKLGCPPQSGTSPPPPHDWLRRRHSCNNSNGVAAKGASAPLLSDEGHNRKWCGTKCGRDMFGALGA